MVNILEIKNKFDNHEIDANTLSEEQIIVLCDMYEEQIQQIESQIADIDFQIDKKKNDIRKKLNKIREINGTKNN